MSFGEIRTWDVGSLRDAEGSHTTRITRLESLEGDLRSAGAWTVSESEGTAGATARLTAQADLVTDEAAISRHAANATRHLANGAAKIKDKAIQLTAEAEGRHFSITDGGEVIDHLAGVVPPEEAAEREIIRRDIEQQVHAIIRQADALVAQAAQALSQAASGEVSDGGAMSVAAAVESQNWIEVPQRGADPAEVAAWWDSLDPTEQKRLLREETGSVGNLDGVPNEIRSIDNIAALPGHLEEWRRRREELEQRLEDLGPVAAPGTPVDRKRQHRKLVDELDEARNKVADLEAVRSSVLDRDGNRIEERRLLLLDPDAGPNVEAAVAYGDVDTAKNVALTVPGYTTTPRDSMKGMVEEAENLAKLSDDLMPSEDSMPEAKTAAIAYMGYQAPQDIVGTSTNSMAHDGAPKVADALSGLAVTSQVQDQHLTAIGHSYGSNVTGIALQQLHEAEGPSPVDDVVVYGSPGIDNIGHAEIGSRAGDAPGWLGYSDEPGIGPLGIEPGHGYYMSNPDDAVSGPLISGKLGPTPDRWGMEELSTEQLETRGETYRGPDEAGLSFDGEGILPSYENNHHSTYPEEGRRSAFNIAAVVAGAPGEARR